MDHGIEKCIVALFHIVGALVLGRICRGTIKAILVRAGAGVLCAGALQQNDGLHFAGSAAFDSLAENKTD